MSLATFLLPASKRSDKKKAIDTELDALFHSETTNVVRLESTSSDDCPAADKKKRGADVYGDEPNSKRPKPSLVPDTAGVSQPAKPKRSGKNRVRIAPELISKSTAVDTRRSKKCGSSDESSSESSDGYGDHRSALVHETLDKDNSRKSAGMKTRYTPASETRETRNARTIFIGNLAPDVAVKRPLKKQLHRHLLAHLPTAKIESTRFRSVAFQSPTSKLPEVDEKGSKDKQPRQHERDRASSWRDAHRTDDAKANEKKFLSPSEKKKIAFINGNIHSDASSVHAYVVFAYPTPHERPSNLPPLPSTMDPFEAAQLAVEKCNGTMFLDRMLRVDSAAKNPMGDISDNIVLSNNLIGDPKLTIFVGNLDFAAKEENLRTFFEGVMSAERGSPSTAGSQDGDQPKHWVTHVRMVRDKDTQLGKGFAYVQFLDRMCVDEVLALEPGKLKFAKRKLRVQRCKSMPSIASSKHGQGSSKPARTSNSTSVPPVPKGDPSLGEKLAKLSKEDRKQAKATDAERVARRMAKKKARLALAKQGVPLRIKGKDRDRVRKTSDAKKLGKTPKKSSKGRIRSERSIAKRNTKK